MLRIGAWDNTVVKVWYCMVTEVCEGTSGYMGTCKILQSEAHVACVAAQQARENSAPCQPGPPGSAGRANVRNARRVARALAHSPLPVPLVPGASTPCKRAIKAKRAAERCVFLE